jgi:hypothetical protein
MSRPEMLNQHERHSATGTHRDFLPVGFAAAPMPDFVRKGVACAGGVFGLADFGFRISRLPFC